VKLEIFDSTLRDGAQSEGISFSVQDKLDIVSALDEFGVSYIEAGNPGSNPKDIEFFRRIAGMKLARARLCAFGSTHRKGVPVDKDANVLSLLSANTQTIAIFGKAWDMHALKILGVSLQENLDLVYETIAFFKERGREVIFDAEHYFDGRRANEKYALDVLDAAASAGADVLCLCDTNGGTTPSEAFSATAQAAARHPGMRIGVHCHNDIGCAVAATMMAVEAGATHVQGTFTGIGERCGNADLGVVIPNLQLKQGHDCVPDLSRLFATAMRISEISNMAMPPNKPYVGGSAFAHKGGMHIDGVLKEKKSFEHISPESVGNRRRFLMSEVSGRNTVLAKFSHIAPELTKDSQQTGMIVEKLKELEHKGYQFEAADASFELLILQCLGRFTPHFSLNMYRTNGEFPPPDAEQSAFAVLSVEVDGRKETTAAMGNGPVHALDTALRKALSVFYPDLSRVRLTDYKVRVLSGERSTAAVVRVLIESTDGRSVWTTVGVDNDIIAASWQALSDSIEYILHKWDKDRAAYRKDGETSWA
jgi:2-isopropylmalate synthase